MAYCESDDLLIGDIPTSAALDPQKYVDDAADEIDSKIGFKYATPIDVSTSSSTPRPVTLLLKRINAHLASGRLIMAATVLQEDEQLNAYGKQLVDDAQLAITAIETGAIELPGVPVSPDAPVTPAAVTTPLISNLDAESNVEAFYGRVANPSYTYDVGGLVR